MKTANDSQSILDRIAIGSSSLCLIHCAVLPTIISFFPALFSSWISDEYFHIMLVFVVVPASAIALFLGCRKHHDKMVLLLGVSGVVGLIAVAMFGHDLLGVTGERIATVLCSLLTVFAHLRNHFLCKHSHCEH